MAGHRFKPEHVQKLHDPKRVQLLPQEEIIRNLCIAPGDRVADLGSGERLLYLTDRKSDANQRVCR